MESNNIQQIIENIKIQEGESFTCNESEIENAIVNHQISYSGIAVKLLSILGGILASAMFVGFLSLADLFNSEAGALVLGIVFMAVAIVGIRKFDTVLLDTFSISFYIIGFASFVFGFSSMIGLDTAFIFLVCFLLSILTIVLVNNYILNFLAVFIACTSLMQFLFSFFYLSSSIVIVATGAALMWMNFSEAKIISLGLKFNQLYKPVQAGLFVSFASFCGGFIHYFSTPAYWDSGYGLSTFMIYNVVFSVIIWMGIIFLVYKIMNLFEITEIRTKVLIYFICALLLIPTFYAPSISETILLLLLSFYFNYKTEFVISIILLIYTVSRYYYDLSLTLLEKSGILFFSGVLFILIWLFFYKKMKKNGSI